MLDSTNSLSLPIIQTNDGNNLGTLTLYNGRDAVSTSGISTCPLGVSPSPLRSLSSMNWRLNIYGK